MGVLAFRLFMWSMPVIAMEPVVQLGGSLIRVLVGLRVSPFSKHGLDESLGLSVCLRRVGFREDLSQTCSCAGGAEGLRPVARTVVRHHAFDVDPEPGEVSSGGHQEGDSALLALVWHDLHESDARGVVNADVDVFPTDAMVTIDDASRSSSDAMPDRADALELLDVEMDQFAWMVALIAPDRLCRLEGRELVEAEPPQNAADGRRRHAGLGSALLGRFAPSPDSLPPAAHAAGAVWLGDESSLDERSFRPSTPWARKRSTHLPTVLGVVLNWRAAAALGSPQPRTARTLISRPFGVKGAFLGVSLRSPRTTEVWRHQRSRPDPNGQPPES